MAKPNYFATMKNFALQLSSEDWMILEFSQLGFIGKEFEQYSASVCELLANPTSEIQLKAVLLGVFYC